MLSTGWRHTSPNVPSVSLGRKLSALSDGAVPCDYGWIVYLPSLFHPAQHNYSVRRENTAPIDSGYKCHAEFHMNSAQKYNLFFNLIHLLQRKINHTALEVNSNNIFVHIFFIKKYFASFAVSDFCNTSATAKAEMEDNTVPYFNQIVDNTIQLNKMLRNYSKIFRID